MHNLFVINVTRSSVPSLSLSLSHCLIGSELCFALTAIIVLVNGLQPANVVMRVCHKMHINQAVISLCAAL